MVNIFLVGRLTADPTLTEINGRSCCNFNVAARTRRKQDDGSYATDFYRVATWGAQAETCSKYLSKGSMVSVCGNADQAPFLTKQGQPCSGMQVTATNVEFINIRQASSHQYRDEEEDMFS